MINFLKITKKKEKPCLKKQCLKVCISTADVLINKAFIYKIHPKRVCAYYHIKHKSFA